MCRKLKLEEQIRRWNKLFNFFGLRAVNADKENLRGILTRPILLAVVVCSLDILQFSRYHGAFLVVDEDGIVRYVHMFGNFVVILQVLLTLGKMNRCTNIQSKFLLLEKYVGSDEGGIIPAYLYFLFPFVNLSFFLVMDIAEYLFWQPQVNPVDVVPIISGHILILYNILYVMHFSLHLFLLRKFFVSLNMELCSIGARLREKLRNEPKSCVKSSTSPPIKEERATEALDIIREIKLCRTLYNESFELGKDINDTYATRNLITVSFNVVIGIIFLAPAVDDMLAVITSKMDPEVTNKAITAQHIMFHCKWSVTCFFTVYGLIWACRLTTSEVNQTSSIVYDTLAVPLDAKVKAELYGFAVQLLQSNVNFSAHEFFTLNNKLFLSILGTFVSYLVIMFQFNV